MEIHAGPSTPSPTTWYEARETSAQSVLTSFYFVLFDDVNANGMPEAGEELLTDFRRTRDQPLSFIRLRSLASGNPEVRARLLALARVTTTTCPQGREVVWQVSP